MGFNSGFKGLIFCAVCNVSSRASEPTARVPLLARGRFFGTRQSKLSKFFSLFLLPDQRLYIVKNMNIYMHVSDCVVFKCELPLLPITLGVKNFLTAMESCAKCCLDIYHWGTGLVVTERICDTGHNFL